MRWSEELDKWAAVYLPDLQILKDEPMSLHTSFRIGGPAKRMALPERGEQLVLLLDFAGKCGARPLVIGKGTNFLAPDEGMDRLVIDTAEGLNRVEAGPEPGTVKAEAGASLAKAAAFACERGLTGLEFAHGIPGSVGGGVCMNAGAYGGEIKRVLEGAAVLFPDEGVRYVSLEELDLGYRHSLLTERPGTVLLYAVFRLEPGDADAIRERMRELMDRRKAAQPLEYPSAGSVFKRPKGNFAGALIEQCGLKGLMVGGAQVSEKHAGFIINLGDATAADVRELIRRIQERVYDETGVRLEPEIIQA